MSESSALPFEGPLAGVRVVEMATVIAGPGCARHLADYGASVIKIERPPNGDPARRMGWTIPSDEDSLYWKLANRGKSSIALDLKRPEDRDRARSLILESDVLVENMRPGRLEALGLGPAALHAESPKLVIVRVSGFGQTGPYSHRPGFATIAEAMSGYSDISGEPGGAPLLPPVALTDEVTGLAAAFGTMLALWHASRTGVGQVVDANLLETMLHLLGPLPAAYASLGYLQPRMGSGIPFTVPRGTYRCADGIYVALSASSESVAARLLAVLGLAQDQRFQSFADRTANREALEAAVTSWISTKPYEEVMDVLSSADVAITRVNSMADVVEDPHVKARGALQQVDGILMQAPIVRLSRTPGSIRGAGPRFAPDGES